MRNYAGAFSLLFILTFISFSTAYAQGNLSERDSTFEAYHKKAWDEIEDAQFSDSLQNHYAEEFYDYYKSHKGKKSAERAFSSAFMMWGNTGNDKHVKEALATLDYDSHLWGLILNSLGNIYHKNEKSDDYIEKLKSLEDKLSDPTSLSQLCTSLLRHYKAQDQNEKVLQYAQKILEISANEWFVNFANGHIHELESLQIGHSAPTFTVKTVEGDSLSLSELQGKFVLLEFWGTWCGPCIPEIPHLKKLYRERGNDSLSIVGIALDKNEKVVKDFVDKEGMNWPQVWEEMNFKGELAEAYNIDGVPASYLINPEGKIVAKNLRGEEMLDEVDQMIADYNK